MPGELPPRRQRAVVEAPTRCNSLCHGAEPETELGGAVWAPDLRAAPAPTSRSRRSSSWGPLCLRSHRAPCTRSGVAPNPCATVRRGPGWSAGAYTLARQRYRTVAAPHCGSGVVTRLACTWMSSTLACVSNGRLDMDVNHYYTHVMTLHSTRMSIILTCMSQGSD